MHIKKSCRSEGREENTHLDVSFECEMHLFAGTKRSPCARLHVFDLMAAIRFNEKAAASRWESGCEKRHNALGAFDFHC